MTQCTSNDYFCRILLQSERTIQRSLKILKENNLIKSYEERQKGTKMTTRRTIHIQHDNISKYLFNEAPDKIDTSLDEDMTNLSEAPDNNDVSTRQFCREDMTNLTQAHDNSVTQITNVITNIKNNKITNVIASENNSFTSDAQLKVFNKIIKYYSAITGYELEEAKMYLYEKITDSYIDEGYYDLFINNWTNYLENWYSRNHQLGLNDFREHLYQQYNDTVEEIHNSELPF